MFCVVGWQHDSRKRINVRFCKKLDLLYQLADEDELWLKRMLNNERGLVAEDEYNKLED